MKGLLGSTGLGGGAEAGAPVMDLAKGLFATMPETGGFCELAAKNGLLVFLELLDMKGLDVISGAGARG